MSPVPESDIRMVERESYGQCNRFGAGVPRAENVSVGHVVKGQRDPDIVCREEGDFDSRTEKCETAEFFAVSRCVIRGCGVDENGEAATDCDIVVDSRKNGASPF